MACTRRRQPCLARVRPSLCPKARFPAALAPKGSGMDRASSAPKRLAGERRFQQRSRSARRRCDTSAGDASRPPIFAAARRLWFRAVSVRRARGFPHISEEMRFLPRATRFSAHLRRDALPSAPSCPSYPAPLRRASRCFPGEWHPCTARAEALSAAPSPKVGRDGPAVSVPARRRFCPRRCARSDPLGVEHRPKPVFFTARARTAPKGCPVLPVVGHIAVFRRSGPISSWRPRRAAVP